MTSDFQIDIECKSDILEYSDDSPCLINEIKYWQHGRLYPMGKYNFFHDPPVLDGQIGVPLVVDELLGKT